MTQFKFINGLNNYFFKKIFGSDILKTKELIKLITKEEIEGDYSFSTPSDVVSKEAKAIEADLLVSVVDQKKDLKVLIDVEPQKYYMGKRLIKRQIHYASMYYSGMYEKNTFYNVERRFIEIYLHQGILNEGNLISKTLFTRVPEGVSYSDITIYDVYVDEFMKLDLQEVAKDDKILVELMQVLGTIELERYLDSKTKLVKDVAEMINGLNQDEKERILAIKRMDYETRERDYRRMALFEGKEEGRKEGLAEGMAKGKSEQLIESINNMLEYGLSKDEISKILKIDINYVNDILKNN